MHDCAPEQADRMINEENVQLFGNPTWRTLNSRLATKVWSNPFVSEDCVFVTRKSYESLSELHEEDLKEPFRFVLRPFSPNVWYTFLAVISMYTCLMIFMY